MKKLFMKLTAFTTTVAMLFAIGCTDAYDDSSILERLDALEGELTTLSELSERVATTESDIESLLEDLAGTDYLDLIPELKTALEGLSTDIANATTKDALVKTLDSYYEISGAVATLKNQIAADLYTSEDMTETVLVKYVTSSDYEIFKNSIIGEDGEISNLNSLLENNTMSDTEIEEAISDATTAEVVTLNKALFAEIDAADYDNYLTSLNEDADNSDWSKASTTIKLLDYTYVSIADLITLVNDNLAGSALATSIYGMIDEKIATISYVYITADIANLFGLTYSDGSSDGSVSVSVIDSVTAILKDIAAIENGTSLWFGDSVKDYLSEYSTIEATTLAIKTATDTESTLYKTLTTNYTTAIQTLKDGLSGIIDSTDISVDSGIVTVDYDGFDTLDAALEEILSDISAVEADILSIKATLAALCESLQSITFIPSTVSEVTDNTVEFDSNGFEYIRLYKDGNSGGTDYKDIYLNDDATYTATVKVKVVPADLADNVRTNIAIKNIYVTKAAEEAIKISDRYFKSDEEKAEGIVTFDLTASDISALSVDSKQAAFTMYVDLSDASAEYDTENECSTEYLLAAAGDDDKTDVSTLYTVGTADTNIFTGGVTTYKDSHTLVYNNTEAQTYTNYSFYRNGALGDSDYLKFSVSRSGTASVAPATYTDNYIFTDDSKFSIETPSLSLINDVVTSTTATYTIVDATDATYYRTYGTSTDEYTIIASTDAIEVEVDANQSENCLIWLASDNNGYLVSADALGSTKTFTYPYSYAAAITFDAATMTTEAFDDLNGETATWVVKDAEGATVTDLFESVTFGADTENTVILTMKDNATIGANGGTYDVVVTVKDPVTSVIYDINIDGIVVTGMPSIADVTLIHKDVKFNGYDATNSNFYNYEVVDGIWGAIAETDRDQFGFDQTEQKKNIFNAISNNVEVVSLVSDSSLMTFKQYVTTGDYDSTSNIFILSQLRETEEADIMNVTYTTKAGANTFTIFDSITFGFDMEVTIIPNGYDTYTLVDNGVPSLYAGSTIEHKYTLSGTDIQLSTLDISGYFSSSDNNAEVSYSVSDGATVANGIVDLSTRTSNEVVVTVTLIPANSSSIVLDGLDEEGEPNVTFTIEVISPIDEDSHKDGDIYMLDTVNDSSLYISDYDARQLGTAGLTSEILKGNLELNSTVEDAGNNALNLLYSSSSSFESLYYTINSKPATVTFSIDKDGCSHDYLKVDGVLVINSATGAITYTSPYKVTDDPLANEAYYFPVKVDYKYGDITFTSYVYVGIKN